jgi:hypothetical protein
LGIPRQLKLFDFNLLTRVGFLPWLQDGGKKWLKPTQTDKNWQKLENAVYVTGIRSLTLPGSSKRLNLLNLNLQL